MMKKINYIGLFMLLLLIGQACSDSETLEPTAKEDMWVFETIKEGNEPYDHWIKAFYDSTGIAILYDWDKNKAFWSADRSWKGIIPTGTRVDTFVYIINTETSNSLKVQTIDTNGDGKPDEVYANNHRYTIGHSFLPHERYANGSWTKESPALERTVEITGTEVGDSVILYETHLLTETAPWANVHMSHTDTAEISNQLELLNNVFLKYYSADFLKKYIGRRILLGKELYHYRSNYVEYPFFYNAFTLLFSWGDKSTKLEVDEIKFLRYYFNYYFIYYHFCSPVAYERIESDIFDEFFAVSGEEAYINRPSDYKSVGFASSSTYTKADDLNMYLQIFLETSLEQFKGEKSGGYKNGYGQYEKCLQKYLILRKIFNKHGIDIDAVREDGAYYSYSKDGSSYYETKFYSYFYQDF
jgi:hypothetical protein